MARPTKDGMDYFPHDTDAVHDEKVEALMVLHGPAGYAWYFILLERIYRTDNFELDISESETIQILSRKMAITPQLFSEILQSALKRGLFNRQEYEERQVLTSHGIKKRAGFVVTKREKMRSAYQSKKGNVSGTVSSDVSGNISDAEITEETPQSKVKKSKEKKIKENNPPISPLDDDGKNVSVSDSADELSPDEGNPLSEVSGRVEPSEGLHGESSPENDKQFMAFWDAYPKKSGMVEGYTEWKKLLSNGLKASDLIMAAGKYALACRTEGTEMKYIKYLPNFLAHKAYVEYLPRNKPNCPRCRGIGWVEGEEPDGYGGVKMVMIQCECRRELSA